MTYIITDRQFGFKKGFSCKNPLNLVKNTVIFFNSKGSTVSLGFVDIRKAFDKASWWGILLLLQKRGLNYQIINIIEHLFSISSAQVRWNYTLSDPVLLSLGVINREVCYPHYYYLHSSML